MKHLIFAVCSGCILIALVGCKSPSLPSLPEIPLLKKDKTEAADQPMAPNLQTTPREIMTARLANKTPSEDTPPITVGKLIEFADRYLACDCSETRFVKSWQRTGTGYLLTTNSGAIKPLTLTCETVEAQKSCFLNEIDRGPQAGDLRERFVPGGEFIEFMYHNGLRCERETPCPSADP
ncbi:MAG: hypothetical protein ACU84Q_20150 [Gammaproteobacteria bacterium]